MWPFWCRFSFCVPEILQEKETGESVRGKEAIFVEEITGVGVYNEVRTTQTPGNSTSQINSEVKKILRALRFYLLLNLSRLEAKVIESFKLKIGKGWTD